MPSLVQQITKRKLASWQSWQRRRHGGRRQNVADNNPSLEEGAGVTSSSIDSDISLDKFKVIFTHGYSSTHFTLEILQTGRSLRYRTLEGMVLLDNARRAHATTRWQCRHSAIYRGWDGRDRRSRHEPCQKLFQRSVAYGDGIHQG
jgi:hypothetical protein